MKIKHKIFFTLLVIFTTVGLLSCGKYTKKSYTVSYMVDAEVYETIKFKKGDKIRLPENDPDIDFQVFVGWYTENNEQVTNGSITVNKNMKLWAKFDAEKYYINYYFNIYSYLVDNPNKETISYGETMELLDPSAEGYTFEGWYRTNPNNYVSSITDIYSDIILNGVFTPNTYNITYVFEQENVSNNNGNTFVYGETLELKDPIL